MSKIRLYGETSGFIELKAPDEADDNTVDLGLVPTVDTVPSDGQVLTWNASLSKWEAKDMKMKEKRIAAFTGDGTWTVPAGVTYAIARIRSGGGGGGGELVNGGQGGSSSVEFASGTVTQVGGAGGRPTEISTDHSAQAGTPNSGEGGMGRFVDAVGQNGGEIFAAAEVTPAASITVTVGAGGTAEANRGGVGGSGLVVIEYYEEA